MAELPKEVAIKVEAHEHHHRLEKRWGRYCMLCSLPLWIGGIWLFTKSSPQDHLGKFYAAAGTGFAGWLVCQAQESKHNKERTRLAKELGDLAIELNKK